MRPVWWLERADAEVGGRIFISIPELYIEGDATVLEIGPCEVDSRSVPTGHRLVTGTFAHRRPNVLNIWLDGQDEPLGVTPSHPIFSADRNTFVAAGELGVGEGLRTQTGIVRVVGVTLRAGRYEVFNLEVHRDHTFFVTKEAVWVHNSYGRVVVDFWETKAGPHVTVRVDDGVPTHLTMNPKTRVSGVEPVRNIRGKLIGTKTINIKDARAAKRAQFKSRGVTGNYCIDTNSCRTHVEDVIRAGGGSVPPGSYSDYARDLYEWFYNL